MTIDLRDVIGVPGHAASFDYSPDLSDLLADSITEIVGEVKAVGEIRNSAGLLTLRAHVDGEVLCVCDRCLRQFSQTISHDITASLSEAESAREDPEYYFIEGLRLDPDEIIVTEIILNADLATLCYDDCQGLCMSCGADLNEGDCGCEPEIDPRLAGLASLLD